MKRTHQPDEAGFTLIELIVALALFGLISIAGLALVESVLSIRARTDGRLERLAEIQRAMFVIDADLTQISPGRLVAEGGVLTFRRHGPSLAGRGEAVRYALAGGTLERTLGGGPAPARVQKLLTGVSAAHWTYRAPGAAWRDGWPVTRKGADEWPAAVAVDLTLSDGAGSLRRVVDLPARP